jgi:apolipoprotein N-acyltransferase
VFEPDGIYLLKLVLVTLCGLLWLKLQTPLLIGGTVPVGAFPVGTVIGLGLISWLEKAQFNRKIMYAVLIVVTIIGFFVDAGIVL